MSTSTSTTTNNKLSCFSKKVLVSSKRQCLSRDFFGDLIKLETDFRSNSYTLNTINDLIQLYVKAVGYYDSIQDEISSYFTFKIQDIIATKKSLTLLAEQKHKLKNKSSSSSKPLVNITPATPISDPKHQARTEMGFGEVKAFVLEENSDEETDSCGEKWKKKHHHPSREQNKSLADLKNERQRFVELFNRFEAEKESLEKNLNSTLEGFKISSQSNDAQVLDDVSNQKKRLLKKIEQRKSATLLSLTMNNSAFYVQSRDNLSCLDQSFNKDNNGSCLDAMLNELDDDSYEKGSQRIPSLGEGLLTPSKIFVKNQRSKAKSLFSRKGVVNFEDPKLSARADLKREKETEEKLNYSSGGNDSGVYSNNEINVDVGADILCDEAIKLEP